MFERVRFAIDRRVVATLLTLAGAATAVRNQRYGRLTSEAAARLVFAYAFDADAGLLYLLVHFVHFIPQPL